MDDTISNPLRFETNPYHNVIIKDREIMEITGVKQIDSFDANGKLDTERGDVVIKGVIESMTYVTNKKGNGKESMITKIFK